MEWKEAGEFLVLVIVAMFIYGLISKYLPEGL